MINLIKLFLVFVVFNGIFVYGSESFSCKVTDYSQLIVNLSNLSGFDNKAALSIQMKYPLENVTIPIFYMYINNIIRNNNELVINENIGPQYHFYIHLIPNDNTPEYNYIGEFNLQLPPRRGRLVNTNGEKVIYLCEKSYY